MTPYLTYNGQELTWWPGGQTFPASSGLPGSQSVANQCVPDAGPIPAGNYRLQLKVDPHTYARNDGTNTCRLSPASGIQKIPRGGLPLAAPSGPSAGACEGYWANWGWNRVRLTADTATSKACVSYKVKRDGFYIHDSTKGFSHGCIEVDGSFFNKLYAHTKKAKESTMLLKVSYKHESTYGGTKKP